MNIENDNLKPRPLSWNQRFEMIQNGLGFIPTTRCEINDAFVAIGETGDNTGFITHLSEVHAHQQKHRKRAPQERSKDALMSKLRSVECYAHNSLSILNVLEGLHAEIDCINPHLDLATAFDTEEPEARPRIISGAMELVRLDILRQAAALGDEFPFRGKLTSSQSGENPKMIVCPNMDKLIEKHLGDFLRETTVHEARNILLRDKECHIARYNFWNGLLLQGSRHEAVSEFSKKLRSNVDFAARILGIEKAR